MNLESFIPAKCCIAPDIPTAIYKSGATIFPVCPTCQSLGTNPASTAARLAPIAAPSLSKVSLAFRSPDYFGLMILGLTAVSAFSAKGHFL